MDEEDLSWKEENKEFQEAFQTVATRLHLAEQYGLVAEVVVWALKAMKEDPTLMYDEAIMIGYNEWIK